MNRIKHLRQQKGWSQEQMAEMLGITRTAVGKYETGKNGPSSEVLKTMAGLFDVSVDYILGLDTKTANRIKRTIPVLGTIPAGVPMEAIEDIIDYEDLSPEEAADSHEYFGLKIRGRSMMPEYLDGDTIIVRRQETARTGEDVVVMVSFIPIHKLSRCPCACWAFASSYAARRVDIVRIDEQSSQMAGGFAYT